MNSTLSNQSTLRVQQSGLVLSSQGTNLPSMPLYSEIIDFPNISGVCRFFFYILKFVIQLFKDIYCITVKIQQGDYVLYLLWKLIINCIFKMFLTNSHHHFLEVVDWLLINTTLSNLSSVLTVGYLRCSHKYFPFMKPLILDIKKPQTLSFTKMS